MVIEALRNLNETEIDILNRRSEPLDLLRYISSSDLCGVCAGPMASPMLPKSFPHLTGLLADALGDHAGVFALVHDEPHVPHQRLDDVFDDMSRPRQVLTSPATIAKPFPASPARAASMVALRASRLVCEAMAAICRVTRATSSRVFHPLERFCATDRTRSTRAPTSSSAISTGSPEWSRC